jgi:hypothetical protein
MRALVLFLALVLGGGVAGLAQAAEVRAEVPVSPVELTFTKWFSPSFPNMVGVVGGDIVGTFAGQVVDLTTSADGRFYDITARYQIIANDPSQSFTALIQGKQSIQRGTAVLDGFVTAGARTGEPVHVEFQVITCTQAASGFCFQGTIRVP